MGLRLTCWLSCCAAWTKARARQGRWRIPERTLLGLCALGGAPLFWVGMQLFHHKTRHRRFAVGVPGHGGILDRAHGRLAGGGVKEEA